MQRKNGFTIIELIIAVSVLSVGIVGVFGSFTIMVILNSDGADRLTAVYLAQEGMEIARNIRDTNWLDIGTGVLGATWDSYENTDCASGCEMDYTTRTDIATAKQVGQWTDGGNYLKMNEIGFYNYTSGEDSKFKRKITIFPVEDFDGESSHILMVKVEVSWNQRATLLYSAKQAETCEPSNCVTLEGTLYD